MKKIIPLLLALFLLCACQSEPTPAETTVPVITTEATEATEPTEETTVPTTEATEATEETTVPTTEAPQMQYVHPLTGELLDEPMTTRPVAVVTNNISAAQPLMGIGSADVLFEHIAEGGGTITRIVAIYTDLENAGVLGCVRSARTYLIDLARSFNAPIVHCGYSPFAETELHQTGYPSFNQFVYPQYFYRDQARLNAGYSSEHTLMIKATDLMKGLQENDFDMTVAPDVDYGMQFTEDVKLDGSAANKITFRFFNPTGKTTTMTYNEEEGVYYGVQKWESKQSKIADGNTNESVPFKNVLILNISVRYAENQYHVFTTMTGEGTGYFACNGEYVPIKWHRENPEDPFTYTLEDGSPVVLGIGKTYIAMLPNRSPAVSFE